MIVAKIEREKKDIKKEMRTFSELILDFLHSSRLPPGIDYLIYLDGYDTLMLGDAGGIVDAFNAYEAEFVSAATFANYPKNEELK